MASIGWRTGTDLITLLDQNCHRFEFAQAVSLLCLNDKKSNLRLTLQELDHRLQFDCYLGEEFAPSEIVAIDKISSTKKRMSISFFGLFGQQGPLPQPFQKWIRDNDAADNKALHDFLGIFNHHLIALMYLIIARHQSSLESVEPSRSRQGSYLAALIGLDPKQPQQSHRLQPLPARFLLAFSGLKSDRRISMPQCQNIIESYCASHVHIDQFVGGWLYLSSPQTTLLNSDQSLLSQAKKLGRNSVLGNKVWRQSMGLTINIGPMGWEQLKTMLPGGEKHDEFAQLLLYLTEHRWLLHVQLFILQKAVPKIRLNAQSSGHNEVRGQGLVQSSWLNSGGRFLRDIPVKIKRRLSNRMNKALDTPSSMASFTIRPPHFEKAVHD